MCLVCGVWRTFAFLWGSNYASTLACAYSYSRSSPVQKNIDPSLSKMLTKWMRKTESTFTKVGLESIPRIAFYFLGGLRFFFPSMLGNVMKTLATHPSVSRHVMYRFVPVAWHTVTTSSAEQSPVMMMSSCQGLSVFGLLQPVAWSIQHVQSILQ